jgi:hypothetical protein
MRGRSAVAARIFAALLLCVAVFALVRWWDFGLPGSSAKYQAVFLSNGQTYFGHYINRLGPYVKIESAYYIQQSSQGEDQQAQPKLVRRGSELHAPYPYVLIPKSSILFVEDLLPDSPVAQFMDKQ